MISVTGRSTAAGFAENAVQEALQSTLEDVVAAKLVGYDKTREIGRSAMKEGEVGGVAGAVANLFMAAIGARRAIVTTRRGHALLAEHNPGALATIEDLAKKDTLSRSDIEKILPGEQTSADERVTILKEIKNASEVRSIEGQVSQGGTTCQRTFWQRSLPPN